ncbi:MAG: translation initiation factor IF-3, partial [Candidatus Moraniibacteriota bacterium]
MKYYAINSFIKASELRVVDETGKQVGLLSREEALEKARNLEVDLVEIAPM